MHRLLQGEVGSGKAQPLDALVLTPGGFRPMGTIRVGDEVVTPSGELAPVDGVFPQGERDVWRLVLSDGSTVECDDEHLWTRSGDDGTWERGADPMVLTTREIRNDLVSYDGSPKWSLPDAVPVDLGAPEDTPADPYAAGLTLASGDAGSVPRPYKDNSVKNRLAMLQGLLDARGETEDDGHGVTFCSASTGLVADVAWLVRSLGGHARISTHEGVPAVALQLPPEHSPFRSEAKLARWSPRHDAEAMRRRIHGVEYVGRKPVQCISVRHPDRAYVTDNFTVTHNTMVALRAMLAVVDAGGQAAMLAPTEVLAQQHHRSITEMMGELAEGGMLGGAEQGTKVVLLTGSMGAAARRQALLDLVTGEAGIVIGTHALIEDKVQFHDLGLVVVDEQHRFGVEQRDALRAKGKQPPHLLVMTATPIPRTVAMTVFGDLETSVLDQLPAGRSPIASHVVPARDKPHFLARAWERVREEAEAGHQAYVVCPRIGDEEDTAAKASRTADEAAGADGSRRRAAEHEADKRPPLAVLDIAGRAQRRARSHGLRVEVLHGRMQPDDKDDGDAPLRRGRGRCAGRHHRHRGRRQRPQRHRHGDHGRRPLRRLPAAPAARPRRPWLGRRACACWSPRCPRRAPPAPAWTRSPPRSTASSSPVSTWSSAARAMCSARPSPASAPRCGCSPSSRTRRSSRPPGRGDRASSPTTRSWSACPELRTALDALLDEEREEYLDKG